MGAGSSKAVRSAASGASKRQYPQRVPPNTTTAAAKQTPPPAPEASSTTHAQGPTVHPAPQISETRDSSIDHDARDPTFAASLRSLGPVQPNATFSPSSTAFSQRNGQSGSRGGGGGDNIQHPNASTGQAVFPDARTNPALRILEARERAAREAESELNEIGRRGRRHVDVLVIRQVLKMRDEQGLADSEIERKLELGQGSVKRLGGRGVLRQAY